MCINSRHVRRLFKIVDFPKSQNQNVEICIGACSMCPQIQISESEHHDFQKNTITLIS